MTDRTTLHPFIEDLVSRRIRPTAGLDMYRRSGGAIRTQEWFTAYREIEANLNLIRELERRATAGSSVSWPLTKPTRPPDEHRPLPRQQAVPDSVLPWELVQPAAADLSAPEAPAPSSRRGRTVWASLLVLIVSAGARAAAAGRWLLGHSLAVLATLWSTASRTVANVASAFLRLARQARLRERTRRAAVWSLHALAASAADLKLAFTSAGRALVRSRTALHPRRFLVPASTFGAEATVPGETAPTRRPVGLPRRPRWSSLARSAVLAALLAWLVWQRPGPWTVGLVVALTALLAVRRFRPFGRGASALPLDLSAALRSVAQRIGVADQFLRFWREASPAARVQIGLLASLNVLIALALLNGIRVFPSLWAGAFRVFVVTALLNVVVLNSSVFSRSRTAETSPSDDSPPVETGVATSPASLRIDSADSPYLTSPDRPQALTPPVPASTMAPPPRPRPRFRALTLASDKTFRLVAAALVVLAAVWIGVRHPGPLLIVAVLILGLVIPLPSTVTREQAITMVLAVAVAVAAIDYLGWRIAVTNWQGWWLAVPLLLAETLGALHVLGFQFTLWPRPSPQPLADDDDPTRHPIFIFIPTVDEGAEVLRPTLEGSMEARDRYLARYPHGQVTIVICNDGRVANWPGWADIDRLARDLGVSCVTRTVGGGAKAGNIEHARQYLNVVGDAFLVIFDSDQIAEPDFLLKTIPPFRDRKVGWVQTGQYYANLNNPVARWADDQQSLFYNLLCPGKASQNSAFICGTNVVIHAAALDEIGGLPQDSVTEDFAASISLHPRWRGVYLTDVLAKGLGPLDIPSYLKQQSRWALGTLGVLRTRWREIVLPKRRGLTLGQRAQYFLACTHYLCGVRDLIYVVSPILFIATGIPAVRTATLSAYLWHFVPYALLGAGAMWYASRGVAGLRGVIIGFGSFPVLVGSFIAVLMRRKVGFSITSKQQRRGRSLNYLWPYAFFLVLCAVALIWATQAKGEQKTSLFISLLWVVYSMVMLGSFLWLAFQDLRFHAADSRAGFVQKTAANLPYPSKLRLRRRDLIPAWSVVLAALMASPILLGSRLNSLPIGAEHSRPFVIDWKSSAAPHLGLSLPVQLLRTRPAVLEHDLGRRVSIIGRTQDIRDRFDESWARRLAARGARPWITLQFGEFGPGHQPPLDASLPSIINGLHDSDLKRWAAEIRDFGRPVYLTVLLHVDKNWSVSSGVAHGGIPEDSAKAWTHVRSVFQAAGAENVAWIWAPADPLHDQAFAPPKPSIDGVLQSFINYPGTRWGDPKAVLRKLSRRYPRKPLFVEVSTAGKPAKKAAWLTRLGHAIRDRRHVYALVYHEGGPGLKLTARQVKRWSFASDPQSLAAMRKMVRDWHAKKGS
jgi:cellulose synthase/poly-beta-1,6-N-acetylglucosamine synthase-like glycosyltransferase